MSNAVSAKREIVVGLVMARLKLRADDDLGEIAAADLHEWFGRVIHHRGEAVEPGAAQHVEQYGLGEVVHRVPGQRSSREHSSTFGARAGLEVRSRFNLDVVEHAGDTSFAADIPDEGGVLVAGRSRVVVDVVHADDQIRVEREEKEPQRVSPARYREVDVAA